MDEFESVYLQDEFNSSANRLCPLDRLKIGEVFQVRQNQFVFVCIHCTQEFQQFGRFTAHVQTHYHSVSQWISPPAEAQDAPSETATADDVEWLFSDSSNESMCGDDDDAVMNVECRVNIHEEDDELANDESFEQEDVTVSLEARFKLKHPLIRVKDTADTTRLLPYFSKKFSFKRTEDQRFKCPMCDYLTMSKANIREHIFTHAEMKIFSCKLCNKDFSRPRNIIIHIEQKHSDVAVLTPERAQRKLKIEQIDNKNIITSLKMNANQKMMYSMNVNGDKSRSQCYICLKTFSRPNGIAKHMKTHTQEKNYQCFTCGSQFARSDHLNRHMQIHEAPKFKCDICDMAFRRSDKMLVHRRKHPETMNYTCEICGLGFMELTSIKTHVNFHCKGRPDVKNVMKSEFNEQQSVDENEDASHSGPSTDLAES